MIVSQSTIQAIDSGRPRINGKIPENSGYTGQTSAAAAVIKITTKNTRLRLWPGGVSGGKKTRPFGTRLGSGMA